MMLALALSSALAVPPPPPGPVVTVLLTLSEDSVPGNVGAQLARNAADFAGPGPILLVRDDAHADEHGDDTAHIAEWLRAGGREVVAIEEPSTGLTLEQTTGYGVVWLSNPGHQVDDESTLVALRAFVMGGGGAVLQGDDMTRHPAAQPLTGLKHLDNGAQACGRPTDNGAGELYRVAIEHPGHPLTKAIAGESFLYGDDIDHSVADHGAVTIVATAVPAGDASCMAPIPVLVGRTGL